MKEQFGTKGTFLVDFYHLSEYLSAASKTVAKGAEIIWLREQQESPKQNKACEVLAELRFYQEPEDVLEMNAPVRRCLRYIESKLDYLD